MATKMPELEVVDRLLEHLTEGTRAVDVTGPWGSGKTLLALQTAERLQVSVLLVTSGRIEAEAVYEDLLTFADPEQCLLFPAWEVLPTETMAPSDDIVGERLNALSRLASSLSDRALNVVVPVGALLQYVIPPNTLRAESFALTVGEERDLEELVLRLTGMGYERELLVEQPGQLSVRGGIFDVFPISSELPYRVEFFGDQIESIRRFEPETQRSIDHLSTFTLTPRSEKHLVLENAAELVVLTRYFPENTLVVLDEPVAIAEEAEKLEARFAQSPFFASRQDAFTALEAFRMLTLTQVAPGPTHGTHRIEAPMRAVHHWEPPAGDFWGQLEQWDRQRYTVVLFCNNPGERQRLLELLEEKGYRLDKDRFRLKLELGQIHAGFASPRDGLAVLSEREIFGRHYLRRVRRRFEAGAALTTFLDLKVGDYVVHTYHGIGRYSGLKRFADKAGDFLAIQYARGDRLYVPVTHIDQVQKYTGGDGARPKLDRLGGATWARTQARVKKGVRDLAQELLKLYAARDSRQGHVFGADTPWQIEFEDAFPYEETPDQARAIIEVKRDMESPRPMDRLICGDVGFGKTEVALRAAFKSVQDGKQVAVLVPTTVLAEQHYATFSERLADYPVNVELLSRFRTPKQQRATIERLKSGEVDIVIGTHRLLSKDLEFKNLGLVVIDEEHRFGVAQKERLKQLRNLVDVVTMSATPIPRTLHLSLIGIRDMSLINTAPNDRFPVHTCVAEFSPQLIKEAIERELARQGQVFFVHNRVQTIAPYAELVRRLAPHARVAVAHGQMPEVELEGVMARFVRHELDVLVCTTIIGSGLDIPNANTIIVNNADQFGLSELYQLRGRVGRYKYRAFAYLLVPGDRAPTEEAQKRLKALQDFATLGGGFRLAMRDLEIRGCGNILGAEQHGYIAAVGLETYSQLLAEAVAELKGESRDSAGLPPFDLAIDAYIPEEYVPSEAQKITLYKRIAGVATVEQVKEMAEEITDRFGPMPAPVRRLLDVMRIRAYAAELGARRIIASKKAFSIEFASARFINRRVRNALTHLFGTQLEFSFAGAAASGRLDKGNGPLLTYRLPSASPDETLSAAQQVLDALAEA